MAARSVLQVEQIGEVAVVTFTCTAILDEQRVRLVGDALAELLGQAERPQLVLNFRGVSRVSSAMLGQVMAVYKAARATGGRVVLCSLHPGLSEVIRAMRLNRVLGIYHNEQDALQSF